MNLAGYYATLGGVGPLTDNPFTRTRIIVTSSPPYVAFPTFQINPAYDPDALPPDTQIFEYWANWVQPPIGDNNTANWKVTANPSGGSGDYSYAWSMPEFGTWILEPTQKAAGARSVYVAQAGSVSASNNLTVTVTDNKTNESYTQIIALSITRNPGGGPTP